MNMKNKVELKKLIKFSLCIIFIFNITFSIFYYYQYKTYTNIFNKKISSIISNISNHYTNIDKNDLIEILNSNTLESNNNILRNYGIDLNTDSAILLNNDYFYKFLILNVIILLLFSITLLTSFLIYNVSKDKKLKQITKYIEQINNKNYKLNIDENSEDELSILKNEIYKTTIMLKEISEKSLQDKINLKDSLSDISHQLKTPLTSITIMLDNILDNENMDKKTRNEFIKDIKNEIININFLVNSLLKLSKLDSNSVNFIFENEYINTIISKSIKNVSVLCDLKNIDIVVDGDTNVKINCDVKWQIEAITNIIKNCVEHSNSSSKIYINFDENELYTKLQIKDNGVGIDKKDLPHIFERFYKGKNSSNESVGIGLALSKSIIEKSNADIRVNSKINEGTNFTIKYYK